jgi:hypothetical protein
MDVHGWVGRTKPNGGRNLRSTILDEMIIIIIITIFFTQGIYTHIPETNNVPKEYNVTAILSLLFMVPISLVPALLLLLLLLILPCIFESC